MKNDGKPKQTEEKKLLQYQDRMPFWPDQFYEQSNPLTRSGLFSISNRKKSFDKFTPVSLVNGGSLEYMGQRLNVFDEDVFLQLLQYYRGQSLVNSIDINRSQLLHDLDIAPSGKSYQRLAASIERLESGRIRISTPAILRKLENLLNNPSLSKNIDPKFIQQIQERYKKYVNAIYEALASDADFSLTVGLIINSGINHSTGRLIVSLDPLLVVLYDGINTTRTNILERRQLSPAEIRLLSYINSHADRIYPIKITTLHEILASDLNMEKNSRRFQKTIFDSLTKLEKLGRIQNGWEIKEGKVSGLMRVPYGEEFESK